MENIGKLRSQEHIDRELSAHKAAIKKFREIISYLREKDLWPADADGKAQLLLDYAAENPKARITSFIFGLYDNLYMAVDHIKRTKSQQMQEPRHGAESEKFQTDKLAAEGWMGYINYRFPEQISDLFEQITENLSASKPKSILHSIDGGRSQAGEKKSNAA